MTPNIRLNIHNSQVYIYNVPNSDDNSNNENIVRNPQVPSRINQSNEKEKDLIPEITKLMEVSHQKYKSFKTPIKVDFGGGLNWGEAH